MPPPARGCLPKGGGGLRNHQPLLYNTVRYKPLNISYMCATRLLCYGKRRLMSRSIAGETTDSGMNFHCPIFSGSPITAGSMVP